MTGKKDSRHATAPALDWIARHAAGTPAGRSVLDLACGGGRHGRLYLARGCAVTFADIDTNGVDDLRERSDATVLEADLEDGPWPFEAESFDIVVVTNYLWRPRLDRLLRTVRRDGELLYQTFARGNEAYGKPSNPDFLLREGELRDRTAANFDTVAYAHGPTERPKPGIVQYIHARRMDRPYEVPDIGGGDA